MINQLLSHVTNRFVVLQVALTVAFYSFVAWNGTNRAFFDFPPRSWGCHSDLFHHSSANQIQWFCDNNNNIGLFITSRTGGITWQNTLIDTTNKKFLSLGTDRSQPHLAEKCKNVLLLEQIVILQHYSHVCSLNQPVTCLPIHQCQNHNHEHPVITVETQNALSAWCWNANKEIWNFTGSRSKLTMRPTGTIGWELVTLSATLVIRSSNTSKTIRQARLPHPRC